MTIKQNIIISFFKNTKKKVNKNLLKQYRPFERKILINIVFCLTTIIFLGGIFITTYFLEKKEEEKKNNRQIAYLVKATLPKVELDFYKITQKLKNISETSNSLEECNIKAKKKVILPIIGHYNMYCNKRDVMMDYTNVKSHESYHRELEIKQKKKGKSFEATVFFSIKELIKNLNLTSSEFDKIVIRLIKENEKEILFPYRKVTELSNKYEIFKSNGISIESGLDKEVIENEIKQIKYRNFFIFLSIETCILLLFFFLKKMYMKFLYNEISNENEIYKKKIEENKRELKILKALKDKINESYIEQIKYYGTMHDEMKLILLDSLRKIEKNNSVNEVNTEGNILELLEKSSNGASFNIKEIFKGLLKLVSYNVYRKNLKINEKLETRDEVVVNMNHYTFNMILYSTVYILFRSVGHDAKISILATENKYYLNFKFTINEIVNFIDLNINSSVFVGINKIDSLLKIHEGNINIENIENKTTIEINIFKDKNFKHEEPENTPYITSNRNYVN